MQSEPKMCSLKLTEPQMIRICGLFHYQNKKIFQNDLCKLILTICFCIIIIG